MESVLKSCIIPARTAGPSWILPENARFQDWPSSVSLRKAGRCGVVRVCRSHHNSGL